MSGSQILVVDDESDIRSLIQEILAEEGYDVTTAADAEEARASWAARHPDLVLLDIWMPDTDGITLLREWSRDEAVNCPVVVMSRSAPGNRRCRARASSSSPRWIKGSPPVKLIISSRSMTFESESAVAVSSGVISSLRSSGLFL